MFSLPKSTMGVTKGYHFKYGIIHGIPGLIWDCMPSPNVHSGNTTDNYWESEGVPILDMGLRAESQITQWGDQE